MHPLIEFIPALPVLEKQCNVKIDSLDLDLTFMYFKFCTLSSCRVSEMAIVLLIFIRLNTRRCSIETIRSGLCIESNLLNCIGEQKKEEALQLLEDWLKMEHMEVNSSLLYVHKRRFTIALMFYVTMHEKQLGIDLKTKSLLGMAASDVVWMTNDLLSLHRDKGKGWVRFESVSVIQKKVDEAIHLFMDLISCEKDDVVREVWFHQVFGSFCVYKETRRMGLDYYESICFEVPKCKELPNVIKTCLEG